MRIRDFIRYKVARPWLLWVALGASLFLFANVARAATPGQIQQIANDWRGYGYPVYCVTDEGWWASTFPVSPGQYYYGVTSNYTHEVYLSPRTCIQLQSQPDGASLLTLLHELYHSVGMVDEAQTECMALGNVYQFIHKYFVADQYQAMDMVNDAWNFHNTVIAQSYRAQWCQAPNFDTVPATVEVEVPGPVRIVTKVVKRTWCYAVNPKTRKMRHIKCPVK